jgi:hypothetical protein
VEPLEWIVNIDSWQQVAVLALVLGYLIFRSHRGAKKVRQVEAKVSTTNANVAAVNDGVAAVTTGVEAVLHQVENNSGTSLKDAVDRIETGQAELVQMFGEHIESSEKDSERLELANERLAALEAKYLDPSDNGL